MHRYLLLLIVPASLVGCAIPPNGPILPSPTISSEASATQSSEVQDSEAVSIREDARSIGPLISRTYAYLDHFGTASMPISEKLHMEAEEVTDRRSLLRYAERVLLTLSDHHAITGSSLADSWAVIPKLCRFMGSRERRRLHDRCSSKRLARARSGDQAGRADCQC